MVNSKGKLLKLALTQTRLSVQPSPQLLLKLSSQLSAARCAGKQVLRFFTVSARISTIFPLLLLTLIFYLLIIEFS